MSDVTRTTISISAVNTPLLNANVANIGKLSLTDVDNLQAKEAFIENLTIKELTVLEEENQGTSKEAETYEEASFNGVVLDFADDYNCVYTTATDSILEADTAGKLLNITFEVPESLGAKLVCRYLVLDLRNEDTSTVIGTSYNGAENLKWLYGMPDIEAGYFYVLAFQRLAKDMIVGNVAVKLEK
jgi:hypothetical protein